jgi:hypothetical protein
MTHRPEEPLDEKVSCEVCLTEVPKSEARSAEGRDYVLYFCGLDCYEAWRKKNRAADSER